MTGLFAALEAFAQMVGLALWPATLVFLRVGAAMALMPALGEQVVPMRVRLALTVALTAVLLPALAGRMPPEGAVLAPAAEIAAGLALGAGLRLAVLALTTAGAMIAQATSLAQFFPGAGEPQPATGHLLTMAGLALAMTFGLPAAAARFLLLSYEVLPAGQLPAAADIARWGTAAVSASFALAFRLAAPFTLAGVVYNLALGLINRAMPSLSVSFVGAPLQAAGGLVLLLLTAPLMLTHWQEVFSGLLSNPMAAGP